MSFTNITPQRVYHAIIISLLFGVVEIAWDFCITNKLMSDMNSPDAIKKYKHTFMKLEEEESCHASKHRKELFGRTKIPTKRKDWLFHKFV